MARDATEPTGHGLDASIQGADTDITGGEVTEPRPVPETAAATEPNSNDRPDPQSRLLTGLGLIVMVIVFWIVTLYIWLWAHGVRLERFLAPDASFLQAVAGFDFLGVSASNPQPSILSLNLEIVMWSICGVTIRTISRISVALSRRRFDFLKHLMEWGRDMMMGAGLAEVVILFLRIGQFSVGTATLTLAEANYETIAALAFILGFYREDAQRLLNALRKRLVAAASSSPAGDTR